MQEYLQLPIYMMHGWDKQKGKDDVAYIFTAIWEVDKIGDGEKPDGIPDKYPSA